jgi:predicted PurR-regulated permease PerM
MSEEEKKFMEEPEKILKTALENLLVKEYGVNIRDILRRFDEINQIVHRMDKNISILDERTKNLSERISSMEKSFGERISSIEKSFGERIGSIQRLQYTLIGGTFGTLIGIILTLITILFKMI